MNTNIKSIYSKYIQPIGSKIRGNKAVFTCLNIILLSAILIQGTYAWNHLTQHVSGALMYIHETYPVELHKYERDADGTYTDIPMENIGFALYRADGTQIEGIYYTDEDGIIHVDLPVGKYYWQEIYYRYGWGPDIDEAGQEILQYHFEVTEDIEEDEPLIIKAYNLPLEADLEVEKTVVNKDGSELTQSQLDTEFEFYIYFSDDGTHKYYITDAEATIESDYIEKASLDVVEDREYLEVTSGETFYLKHGQVAVFVDLPVGLTYSVHETRKVNYYTASVGHLGNIVYGGNKAHFTNTYDPIYGSLLVSKEVVNDDGSDLTQDQLDKEFLFTATIDGEEVQFVLKHGEEHLLADIPVGTKYRVEEFDYIDEEYYATVLVYEGEILGEYEHVLPFVNVYDPVEETGDLIVRKVLVAPEGSEDDLDYDLEFEFEATFEYEDGRPDEVVTFTLKGDELGDPSLWKIFEDLPVGTKYTIREIGTNGYLPQSEVVSGYITGRGYVDEEPVVEDDAELENLVEDETTLEELEEDEITLEDLVEDTIVAQEYTLSESRLTDEEIESLLADTQVVTFYNHLPDLRVLEITKEVTGDYPFADADKEFLIRLYLDGELYEEFTLKAGEMKSFEVPFGATYDVWEQDYLGDGYSQLISGGHGTIWEDLTQATVVNDYVEERVDIEGEKTWSTAIEAQDYIPEYIIVRLMLGDSLIEEQVVRADEDGEWHYAFSAPKDDRYGVPYEYRIEEVVPAYFYPEYDGYDIHNEFVESVSVLLPVLEKQVIGEEGVTIPSEKFNFVLRAIDGAPMPMGTAGEEAFYVEYGPGEQLLGEIRYASPGVYKYTIQEVRGESENWIYDESIYYLEVIVERVGNDLLAQYVLHDGENVVERVVFVNEYLEPEEPEVEEPEEPEVDEPEIEEPEEVEQVVIAGQKTWNHGLNSVEHQPKNLLVYLLRDGDIVQAVDISSKSNWSYSFIVPKYDSNGELISYVISEEPVKNYIGEVIGYNLINTFDIDSLSTDSSDTDGNIKTGDDTDLLIWIFTSIVSAGLFIYMNTRRRFRRK